MAVDEEDETIRGITSSRRRQNPLNSTSGSVVKSDAVFRVPEERAESEIRLSVSVSPALDSHISSSRPAEADSQTDSPATPFAVTSSLITLTLTE